MNIIILIVIMAIIIIFLSILLIKSINRIAKYEQIIIDTINVITEVKNLAIKSNETLHQIDINGSFEADDEVGSTWIMIRDTIAYLNDAILNKFNVKITNGKTKKN
jgi:uncharacterized membrane protein YqiK